MSVRKMLVAAGVAALTTTPAWAHPSAGDHPGSKPDTPAGSHQGSRGGSHSHRCTPHGVAYVAAGTLVDQSLTLDGSDPTPTAGTSAAGGSPRPTDSGDVTIDVTRTNHHARADKGTTKTYTLDHARVLFGLDDQNGDGSVGPGDLAAGDRVKVIGKVTMLRKRCDQTGFTPEVTIKKLIVHAPEQTQA